MSRAASTGVREERNTSKLRTSPSISNRGSTSLVVGMFLEILLHSKTKTYTLELNSLILDGFIENQNNAYITVTAVICSVISGKTKIQNNVVILLFFVEELLFPWLRHTQIQLKYILFIMSILVTIRCLKNLTGVKPVSILLY